MTPLKIVTVISGIGVLFSGYLSYLELFGNTPTCLSNSPIPGNIPACVMGLVMYIIIFGVCLWGLSKEKSV